MARDQEFVGLNPDTVYWMDVSDLLAITLKEKLKIKVAKWVTPKKIWLPLYKYKFSLITVGAA